MFETLVKWNCFSTNMLLKKTARNLLEKFYCCQISCTKIAQSVLFAHNGRGCTIVAAMISENVVIFQNVSIGSNLKYNKITKQWENVGNPIIAKNVVICDGAKIFGPVVINEGSIIAAGAIITKDVPKNSIAYGTNQFRVKDSNYNYAFHKEMIDYQEIIAENKRLINIFEEAKLLK